MYALCPMLMCRVREGESPDQEGMRQMAPVSPRDHNPPLASPRSASLLIPPISHVGNLV